MPDKLLEKRLADLDAQLARELADLDEKMQLVYEHELMHRVLLIIANCQDGSTMDGVRGLAEKTVYSLGKPPPERPVAEVIPFPEITDHKV